MRKSENQNMFFNENLLLRFTWIDYSLFSCMMILSIAIGIYFGCFGTKQKTKSDYLLGGKKMQIIPIAISLIASDISGVTLLGAPADIYRYGANYVWSCFAIIIACTLTAYVYLPVFHKLQLTSTYEYLKLRFDARVHVFASMLFTVSTILYSSIVIYIPALALEHSTGISLHFVAPILCGICIFYTTIGGLKAVVWTDAIQMVAMVASIVFLLVLGTYASGGVVNIIDTSLKGGRLDILHLNLNPTLRDGICALIIGETAKNIAVIGVSQATVQRFLSLPSLSAARRAILFFTGGIIFVRLSMTFIGLIIYTKYSNCDPISSGVVNRLDQILPYFVMDTAGHIPGLSGLFIAGIFSASFSTLSANLNTLAGTIYQDFILLCISKNISERSTSLMLKLITIFVGVICTGLVFVVEKMGSVLALVISFTAITGGPLAGLFTLGMIFPVANPKGVLFGALSGMGFVAWLVIGSKLCKAHGYCQDSIKPISVAQCLHFVNTTEDVDVHHEDSPISLYQISFWYYNFIGVATTIVIGLLVSCCTRSSFPQINKDLLSPVVVHMWNRCDKPKDNTACEHQELNLLETEGKK